MYNFSRHSSNHITVLDSLQFLKIQRRLNVNFEVNTRDIVQAETRRFQIRLRPNLSIFWFCGVVVYLIWYLVFWEGSCGSPVVSLHVSHFASLCSPWLAGGMSLLRQLKDKWKQHLARAQYFYEDSLQFLTLDWEVNPLVSAAHYPDHIHEETARGKGLSIIIPLTAPSWKNDQFK